MKVDDLLDTYYFTKVNRAKIEELVRDYPSVFTKEKKVPLNFQLRMTEITERSSVRFNEKRERLSVQNRVSKIDLRRRYMTHVLETREEHKIFEALCDEEDVDKRVWFLIGADLQLRGPLTCQDMQELFEARTVKPETLIKKKLAGEFSQACFVLNKYCRMKLVSTSGGGSLAHFSSPKNKKLVSEAEEDEKEQWLKVIGKRPDLIAENPLMSTSRPTSFSGTHSAYREERLSLSFKNPKMLDLKSRVDDPSKLFDDSNRHEFVADEHDLHGHRKKRNSLKLEAGDGAGQNFPNHGFRKRVATTNYRKPKK